ncbi:MAG: hypothetical protein ACFFDT_38550 [Candidatus Hodarchaeota archaeon]
MIIRNKNKKQLIIFILLLSMNVLFFVKPFGVTQAKIQWSHKTHGFIAENAIESLPSPWKEFFLDYSDFLVLHSDDPDGFRSYLEDSRPDLYPQEEPRHFDDHNLKEKGGTVYDEHAPENAHLIDGKFTNEDIDFVAINVSASTMKYQKGVIEWTVQNYTKEVTNYMAIVASDPTNNTAWQMVLIKMAWLAHYASDATMPFHGTANYDGQLTGQTGIHGYVENTMTELPGKGHIDDVNFSHPAAVYVVSPFNQTVSAIETGLGNVSTILAADKSLDRNDASWIDGMWAIIGKMWSARIDLAAVCSANLWYTALIDSGLFDELDETELSAITIDVSGIVDPYIPPLPPKPTKPKDTTTTKATSGYEILMGIIPLIIFVFLSTKYRKK